MYGRVVIIGSRGTVEVNPRDAMGKDATILGVALPNIKPDELIAIHSALVAGLEDKTLRPWSDKSCRCPKRRVRMPRCSRQDRTAKSF